MSIFDKIAEAEMEREEERKTKELNHLRRKLGKDGNIEDQTIMFWNLQLQFMGMSEASLYHIYQSLIYSKLYVKNNKSKIIGHIVGEFSENYIMSEDDRLSLATHLALQLSGLS